MSTDATAFFAFIFHEREDSQIFILFFFLVHVWQLSFYSAHIYVTISTSSCVTAPYRSLQWFPALENLRFRLEKTTNREPRRAYTTSTSANFFPLDCHICDAEAHEHISTCLLWITHQWGPGGNQETRRL